MNIFENKKEVEVERKHLKCYNILSEFVCGKMQCVLMRIFNNKVFQLENSIKLVLLGV